MDAVGKLLRTGAGGELARVARSGLVGWRAMLNDAVRRCPDDPGRAAALELIRQLDGLLGEPPADAPEPRADPVVDSGLAGLVAAFAADPGVAQAIDEASLAGLGGPGGPDVVWRGLHLCLLRLPDRAAAAWRARAAPLAAPAPAAWRSLPGEAEAVLVPVQAAAAQLRSAGYRTAPDAPLDEEVAVALDLGSGGGRPDADAAELGRLGSLLLGLTQLDENLVICLESTLFQGSRRLDEELHKRYRADLIGRLREYARSAPGSAARFEALLDVDEAVNSLTHRPPPEESSWWARVRQQSRTMVDRSASALRKAGTDVEVMSLSLRYRDVRDLTGGNDVASRSGGTPGDVLACLRLWARIEGKTLPGRVMYRT
jgi:hypothetical protein